VVSSCAGNASGVCRGLTHHGRRDKHLWAVAGPGLQLTCLLIRLGMRIFSHVEVFVDKVVIDNLMAVDVPNLVFLAVSVRRGDAQTRDSCSLLRFELYLCLLYRIAQWTHHI
jgi:hypothetical protein